MSTSLLGKDEVSNSIPSPNPMDLNQEEEKRYREEMEEASIQEKIFKILSFFGFQFTISFPLLLFSCSLFVFFICCVFISSIHDVPTSFSFPFFNTNIYLSLFPCLFTMVFLLVSIGDQLLHVLFPLRNLSDTPFWQYNQNKYSKATVWVTTNLIICLIELALLILVACLALFNMICFFALEEEWISGIIWAFFLISIVWRCLATVHHPFKWIIKSMILINRQSPDVQWKILKQFQFLRSFVERQVNEEEAKSRKLKVKLQHHHSSVLHFLFFHGNELVFLLRFVLQVLFLLALSIVLLVVTTNNTLSRVSSAIKGNVSWDVQHSQLVTLPSSTKLHIQCHGTLQRNNTLIILESDVGMISHFLWSPLLQPLSQISRTCVYDRAGYGFSTNGRFPRTISTMAEELHELLTTSKELNGSQSILFVSQSYGTWISRKFAHKNPELVKGMILLDPPMHLPLNTSYPIVEAFRNEITQQEWNGVIWESFGSSKQRNYFHIRNSNKERVVGTQFPYFMTGNAFTFDVTKNDWKWQSNLEQLYTNNRYLLTDYFEKYFADSSSSLSFTKNTIPTIIIASHWYQLQSCESNSLLQQYMNLFVSIEECNSVWKPFQSQLYPMYSTHLQQLSSSLDAKLQIWTDTSPWIAWHKSNELLYLIRGVLD